MTTSEIIKQLFLSFSNRDNESFELATKEYIEREKRKKHNIVAKELKKALYNTSGVPASQIECRIIAFQ